MVERVKFSSTGASSLRISVAGVSADAAQFENLIFDANQPPLRLWATGWGQVRGPTYNQRFVGGQNIVEAVVASGYVTPTGAPPIFVMMQRGIEAGVSATRLGTPFMTLNLNNFEGGGCGVSISGGYVSIFSTNCTYIPTGDGNELSAISYVNYAIFKNY